MKKIRFAKLIGVTPQTLSKILSGGKKYQTSIATAQTMAEHLRFKSAGALIDCLEKDPQSVSAAIVALPD